MATNSKTDAHTAKPHTPSLFDLAEEKTFCFKLATNPYPTIK